MGRITERTILSANKAITAGLQRHFAANRSFWIDGKRRTVKWLIAALADEAAQLAARKRARAQWLAVSRSTRATVNANHELRQHLRIAISGEARKADRDGGLWLCVSQASP